MVVGHHLGGDWGGGGRGRDLAGKRLGESLSESHIKETTGKGKDKKHKETRSEEINTENIKRRIEGYERKRQRYDRRNNERV
jgi:hypothetical protein